jgi:hypothetical protein
MPASLRSMAYVSGVVMLTYERDRLFRGRAMTRAVPTVRRQDHTHTRRPWYVPRTARIHELFSEAQCFTRTCASSNQIFTTSTRRLFARPSDVVFFVTGFVSP